MSQSVLYHEHGVSVYRYQSTFYKNGKTFVRIYLPREEYRCSCCGSDHIWVKETIIREFRSVPVGSREIIIVASIPKFYCHECKAIRQASIPRY
ncbi:MAG: transposase family protein [Planctomycetia bacterium]|nr:transposase family protein [Planctomycetia bacterium]